MVKTAVGERHIVKTMLRQPAIFQKKDSGRFIIRFECEKMEANIVGFLYIIAVWRDLSRHGKT